MNNFTEVQPWSIEELIDCFSDAPVKKKKIKIPPYQRNLVWDSEQKRELINSLKKGMPIGALLLFNLGASDNYNIYSLIDGLQRTATIKSYCEKPTSFFNKVDLDADFTNMVYSYILDKGSKFSLDEVETIVIEWIKSLNSFTDKDHFAASYLTTYIDEKIGGLLDKGSITELNNNILPKYLSKIRDDSNLMDIKLPVIIYSGDESNLPFIFKRLNSSGTFLSKYQIYAATWSVFNGIQITNTQIIDKVRDKYDTLIEDGFEIENYDPNNFYKSKFNYFEYYFGFGKYLAEKFPLLFNASSNDGDVESIGFNVGCICVMKSIKKMDILPSVVSKFDINKLESCIIDSVNTANEILKPFISIKANRKKGKIVQTCHSEMQIVSIIGKLFNEKFNENLDEKVSWKAKEAVLKKTIPYYYLYDIIRNNWSGTGDAKASDFSVSLRYETVLFKENWEICLNEFFENEKQRKEKVRIKINPSAILFLRFIYTHILSAHEELSAKEFEIDHIVPIAKFSKLEGDGFPISTVANLCLIEKTINRDKAGKTIYEYYKELTDNQTITNEQSEATIKELEKYTFTKEQDLSFTSHLFEDQKKYEVFIDNRFIKLKKLFYKYNNIKDRTDPMSS